MLKTRQEFHNCDEVFWNDPDDGLCSGVALFIEYLDEHVATIRKDGVAIDVYLSELQ